MDDNESLNDFLTHEIGIETLNAIQLQTEISLNSPWKPSDQLGIILDQLMYPIRDTSDGGST